MLAGKNPFAGIREHHCGRYRFNIRYDWEERSSKRIMLAMDWVFVSPPNSHWSPNPQCEGIWRWSLWQVIRSWGWSPHGGISALMRRDVREKVSPSRVKTQQEGVCVQARKSITRTQPGWHPDLGLPASRTVRSKCLLFKPPSLLFFYSSPSGLTPYSP